MDISSANEHIALVMFVCLVTLNSFWFIFKSSYCLCLSSSLTPQLLSRKDKSVFERLAFLMSKEDNYKRLRDFISTQSMVSCIPYLGRKQTSALCQTNGRFARWTMPYCQSLFFMGCVHAEGSSKEKPFELKETNCLLLCVCVIILQTVHNVMVKLVHCFALMTVSCLFSRCHWSLNYCAFVNSHHVSVLFVSFWSL